MLSVPPDTVPSSLDHSQLGFPLPKNTSLLHDVFVTLLQNGIAGRVTPHEAIQAAVAGFTDLPVSQIYGSIATNRLKPYLASWDMTLESVSGYGYKLILPDNPENA